MTLYQHAGEQHCLEAEDLPTSVAGGDTLIIITANRMYNNSIMVPWQQQDGTIVVA